MGNKLQNQKSNEMLVTEDPCETKKLKQKAGRKKYKEKTNKKKAGLAILILDKTEFEVRSIKLNGMLL